MIDEHLPSGNVGSNMEQLIVDSIKNAAKPIVLTEARVWSDIFEKAVLVTDLAERCKRSLDYSKEWKVAELASSPPFVREGAGRAYLCTFCTVNNLRENGRYRYLDVTPKEHIFDVIEQKMLLSDGFHLNFEIFEYKDGTALVSIHYNQISGSRWLAIIDANTVPR